LLCQIPFSPNFVTYDWTYVSCKFYVNFVFDDFFFYECFVVSFCCMYEQSILKDLFYATKVAIIIHYEDVLKVVVICK